MLDRVVCGRDHSSTSLGMIDIQAINQATTEMAARVTSAVELPVVYANVAHGGKTAALKAMSTLAG